MAARWQPNRGTLVRKDGPGLDAFVENLPGNVYRRVRRPNGTYYFEYLSSGLFRQFGIDHQRLLAEKVIRFDWIHPDDQGRFVADLEISAATLAILDHRVRIIGRAGRVHWARGIARPSRRSDGSTVWDGIVIDVTREIEAEAALRVAKEEADRAHAVAAGVVSQAAARLGPPLRDLDEMLDGALGGKLEPGMRRALRTCQVRLATALGRLGANFEISVEPASQVNGARVAAALTERQTEVLRLLSSGLTNKGIAQRLNITPGTAKLHVAAVLRAVGARTRRDLRSFTT